MIRFLQVIANSILFIKDGGIHQEVKRGDQSRFLLSGNTIYSWKLGTVGGD